MGDRISKMQFWEALEYSGNHVDYEQITGLYEMYKSKKAGRDYSISKTIRDHAEERADTIINLMKQDGNVSEVFRSLL